MYPNLYYILKDLFGISVPALSFLNTFGLLVAIAFAVAAWVLSAELKRKEKEGLLNPVEEEIEVGKPAGIFELLINGISGFLFGYKILGIFLTKPADMNPQDFIFSSQGSWMGGIVLAAILVYIKWHEKNKVRLKQPEKRIVRIWPHDRVGDIIVLGLVFGILGAKLFDNLEHWDDFIAHPIQSIFSPSGLAYYGGLILATIAILIFAKRKKIPLQHLVDAAAPALIIAYAVGRLGCQLSGDGDWGIYNSAYVSDSSGKIMLASSDSFRTHLQKDSVYYLQAYPNLDAVPHKSIKAPGFLPDKLFAFAYPQNVNKDGIVMPGVEDEHNRVLPSPVFPTPLYESIISVLLFGFLWLFRKKWKKPMMMFGVYLILNGLERFTVEQIRINDKYAIFGLPLTQAEIIAIGLMLIGLVLAFRKVKPAEQSSIAQ